MAIPVEEILRLQDKILVQQEGEKCFTTFQQSYLEHRARFALSQQRYQEHQRRMSALLYKQLEFAYYLFLCEQKYRELEEEFDELKLACLFKHLP